MNKPVICAQDLVSASLQIAKKQGLSAITMRGVAALCGVSVGTVYNYFESKEQLMSAAVQSVWQQVFHRERPCDTPLDFVHSVQWLYRQAKQGVCDYPNFFTDHALGFANLQKGQGRHAMETYFFHIKQGLLSALQADKKVKPNAFDHQFTQEAMVQFAFESVLLALAKPDGNLDFLCNLIARAIYE